MKVRNTFIIFLVSGFWHGANWTFIIWGALNAIYFLPSLLRNKNRDNLGTVAAGKYLPTLKELMNMGITFALTVFAWIFFRAESVTQAFQYIRTIFSRSLFTMPDSMAFAHSQNNFLIMILLLLFFIIVEWIGRERQYAIAGIGLKLPRMLRWFFYFFLIFLMAMYMSTSGSAFIYFQF
jgi:D-alanyl-lipoteichoic acid acyltransferase DltB (MBOAT superfamily)